LLRYVLHRFVRRFALVTLTRSPLPCRLLPFPRCTRLRGYTTTVTVRYHVRFCGLVAVTARGFGYARYARYHAFGWTVPRIVWYRLAFSLLRFVAFTRLHTLRLLRSASLTCYRLLQFVRHYVHVDALRSDAVAALHPTFVCVCGCVTRGYRCALPVWLRVVRLRPFVRYAILPAFVRTVCSTVLRACLLLLRFAVFRYAFTVAFVVLPERLHVTYTFPRVPVTLRYGLRAVTFDFTPLPFCSLFTTPVDIPYRVYVTFLRLPHRCRLPAVRSTCSVRCYVALRTFGLFAVRYLYVTTVCTVYTPLPPRRTVTGYLPFYVCICARYRTVTVVPTFCLYRYRLRLFVDSTHALRLRLPAVPVPHAVLPVRATVTLTWVTTCRCCSPRFFYPRMPTLPAVTLRFTPR